MKCPTCGAWTEILESVLRKDGSRRRRYQCGNLHKFNTVERIEELTQGGWRHGNRTGPSCTLTKQEALKSIEAQGKRVTNKQQK